MKPAKIRKPPFRWAEFLHERAAMIQYWKEVEGLTNEDIVATLRTDPVQIQMIYDSTKDDYARLELAALRKKRKRGKK